MLTNKRQTVAKLVVIKILTTSDLKVCFLIFFFSEMNGSPRSISPLDSPIAGSPTASDSPTFCLAENGGDEQIIFEGYLYKIPPLKKSLLMVVSLTSLCLTKLYSCIT